MAKRIIQQARGKGSPTYRVRRKAFVHRIAYMKNLDGEGKVVSLINSGGHSTPLMKIVYKENNEVKSFIIPAGKEIVEGQRVEFGGNAKVENGNILPLKSIPIKTHIYNIESRPRDGGKYIRTGGTYGEVSRIIGNEIFVIMPSKKEKSFSGECRATIGVIAGDGRTDKPFVKAGRKHFAAKVKNKLWPRTSAIKMNAIDHPFGSGRGKNPKSKIAKRNAPPGAKVGLLRPRRTGRKKR